VGIAAALVVVGVVDDRRGGGASEYDETRKQKQKQKRKRRRMKYYSVIIDRYHRADEDGFDPVFHWRVMMTRTMTEGGRQRLRRAGGGQRLQVCSVIAAIEFSVQ
jgi:hypothetical protein